MPLHHKIALAMFATGLLLGVMWQLVYLLLELLIDDERWSIPITFGTPFVLMIGAVILINQ